MQTEAKQYIEDLGRKRAGMVKSMRENDAWEGFKRMLSDLYPDEAHFIYELLQNAEDAQATSVKFQLSPRKLVFVHDGKRLFKAPNAESITNIGNSTKRDDVNEIGKFGVGFKAVFAYSITPQIYSGDYSFEIRDLFVPHWLENNLAAPGETRFEFPFNAAKSPHTCVAEVSTWLRQMQDNVLLFLRNIRHIRWDIGSSEWAEIERHELRDDFVEIRHNVSSQVQQGRSYWLRFTEAVDPGSSHNVAAAFRLGFLNANQLHLDGNLTLDQQVKIVPVPQGQLSVYFPAEGANPKLHFHLHGPYAATVARDSIPVSHPENRALLGKTARLLGVSMGKIKALGLLTTEFLEVLPNSTDELTEFYQPILRELERTFKSQPLVPVDRGGYAPAGSLFKGPARLREVITKQELGFFTGSSSAEWVAGVQQNQRADKFLEALGIKEWSWPQLYAATSHKFGLHGDKSSVVWLAKQSDEWMQSFYALLGLVITEEGFYRSVGAGWQNDAEKNEVRRWQIIRLETGSHRNATSSVFLPEEGASSSEFPTVKAAVLKPDKPKQAENARGFLIAMGVRKVDERDRILPVLQKHYMPDAELPNWPDHVEHMKRFVRCWSEDKSQASLFQDYIIFFTENSPRARPRDAYLDAPIAETGLGALFSKPLHGIPTRWPLRVAYLDANIKDFNEFCSACGVLSRLAIRETDSKANPKRAELLSSGGGITPNEKDEDYTIEGLNAMFCAQNPKIALLIWRAMCNAPPKQLEARYRPNANIEFRLAQSQLVWQLSEAAWIPDKNGNFRKPHEMRRDDLPVEFAYDDRNGWLAAIGFESKRKQDPVAAQEKRKAAASLGIPIEALELLDQLTEAARTQEIDLFLNQLRRRKQNAAQPTGLAAHFTDELAKSLDRPGKPPSPAGTNEDSPVANPAHRRQRTDEDIETARAQEPGVGERSRLVARKVWESKNPEVRAFLKEQYDGHCQSCTATFPKRDGENYFEARYLVPRTDDGAAWFDRPGNALCLCATCCAKFEHGSVESPDNIVERLRSLKLKREDGTQPLSVQIRLCHEEVSLRFTERHLIDLQQMLAAEIRQVPSPALPTASTISSAATESAPAAQPTALAAN